MHPNLRFVFIFLISLIAFSTARAQDNGSNSTDPLVRVLVTKGVLTTEEARSITMKASPAEQRDRLATAQDWVADALAADGLVYVTGSGHSHMIAEEVFYRAGGAAAVQAILDPALMLHQGAHRSTVLERLEGYAETVLEDYPIGPRDVLFVASNSGRNAFPIEAALFARIGADVDLEDDAVTWFGEGGGQVVVTCRPEDAERLQGIALEEIGVVGGDTLLGVPVEDLREAWETPF